MLISWIQSAQRELPVWLYHTFVTLDSGHPLKELVAHEKHTPDHYAMNQPRTEILHVSEEESTTAVPANDDIFAYTPPVADTLLAEDEQAMEALINNVPYTSLPTIADDEAPEERRASLELTSMDQPAQKSVHFLTPIRPSPISISESEAAGFNPFRTPGPASRFSIFSPTSNSSRSKHTADETDNFIAFNESSSDYTLTDNFEAPDNYKNRTMHRSNVSIDLNPDSTSLKPFSTPGPIFQGLPSVYTDAHFDDLPTETLLDDIQLSPGRTYNGTDCDVSKATCFPTDQHTEPSANEINADNADMNILDSDTLLDLQDVFDVIDETTFLDAHVDAYPPADPLNDYLSPPSLIPDIAYLQDNMDAEPDDALQLPSYMLLGSGSTNVAEDSSRREEYRPQASRTNEATLDRKQKQTVTLQALSDLPAKPEQRFNPRTPKQKQVTPLQKRAKFRPSARPVPASRASPGSTKENTISLLEKSSDEPQEKEKVS